MYLKREYYIRGTLNCLSVALFSSHSQLEVGKPYVWQWSTKVTSIPSIVMKNQLRWSDHLVRLDDGRLPKQLFMESCRLVKGLSANHWSASAIVSRRAWSLFAFLLTSGSPCKRIAMNGDAWYTRVRSYMIKVEQDDWRSRELVGSAKLCLLVVGGSGFVMCVIGPYCVRLA